MQTMENPEIEQLLQATKQASARLATTSDAAKTRLLEQLAWHLDQNHAEILKANALDLAALPDSDPKKDRLRIDPARLSQLAESVRQVSRLPDPCGQVLVQKTLSNGLNLTKKTVPFGVVGVIYESRPNVTIDVSALCLRSGNAVVLKGGKEARHSNEALTRVLHMALEEVHLPTDLVQLLPSDRSVVEVLFQATRWLDVLIPRGSDALIQYVRQNALVPTIETGAGVVHTYVHASARPKQAAELAWNAKTSRPSVCNALDTLLVDSAVLDDFWSLLLQKLQPSGVRIHADPASFQKIQALGYEMVYPARPEDFGKEWLDLDLSIRVVSGPEEALEHISTYSSRHSEAIVAEDPYWIERFLDEVDAAAVYVNASTRFTDGGEFGLGAEMGISTQKLHARGPFALEKLVTEKWIVRGQGQIRI
jgi:glutamate-5-semialdehyde dehydrogenase